MKGKGWVDVRVEPAQKHVHFFPSHRRSLRETMAGYEDVLENTQILRVGANESEFRKWFAKAGVQLARLSHELRDGRVVLSDMEQLNHPSVVSLFRNYRAEFEDIPGDADLGGFGVESYHRYWQALFRWSHGLVFQFMRNASEGKSQAECISTQSVPTGEFLESMSVLSGLDDDTVRRITERLTWGNSVRRPDLMLQPLLVGPASVSWSVRSVDVSKYSRNMLKLMAKMGGPTKKIADNLIGRREAPAAVRLGEFMARKRSRWQFASGKAVKSNGREGEIDLLGWTPNKPDEVLLIEYKATLEVAEIHEIGEATAQMLGAQDQLRRCIEILDSLPVAGKKKLFPFVPWEKIKAIYGIVVSSGGNPSEQYDHNEFPAVTRTAFLRKLRSNDFARPSRLWAACRDRTWLEHLDGCRFDKSEVRVGDISYFLPAIALDGKGADGGEGED